MMQPGCDERHETWPLFLKTYAVLLDVLEAELQQKAGIPLTWFDVLIRLYEAPAGRMRMHDLAEQVLLSKSGFTRLADRMERAGLIARRTSEGDRRVVFAAITKTGRETFDRAAPIAFRGVKKHFTGPLTGAEIRAMRSALRKILRGLEPAGRQPRRAVS